MPQRRIQKPKFDGSDSRRGTYDDENSSFFNRAGGGSDDGMGTGGQSARKASRRAGQTLGNIDDVLNDTANDAPSGFYNNGQGGGGSGGLASDDSSFYGGDSGYDDASETETAGGNSGSSAPERSLTPSQVGAAEASADSGASGAEDGIPFKHENKRGFRLTRRQGILAGVAGLLGGSGLFLGGIAAGPFELIHLAQVLSHSFSKTESDSSDRSNHFFRYARAWKNKSVSYTRVGLIGSKVTNGVLDKLEAKGVTIETNIYGQPTDVVLDRAKLAKSFPETKGMTETEFKQWAAKTLSSDKVSIKGSEIMSPARAGPPKSPTKVTEFRLDSNKLNLKGIGNVLTNAQVSILDTGKPQAGLKTRIMKKWFGLGSLFHPFTGALDKKIKANLAEAAKDKSKAREDSARGTVDTAGQAQLEGVETQGVSAAERVKGALDGVKSTLLKTFAVGGAVLALACVVSGGADEIITVDRDLVVVPSALKAASLIGMGSQTMAGGSDITAEQVGGAVDGLTDANGKSIWASAPMHYLSGDKTPLAANAGGEVANDIPNKYSQAFDGHTTAQFFKDTADKVLSIIPGGASTACSLAATVVVIGVGIVAQVAAIASAPETGGASIAAKYGVGKVIETGLELYAFSALVKLVEDEIVHSNTAGKLAKDAFSGPLGGSLLAFGAREAGNMTAIASGGLSLANDAATFVSEDDQADQQYFESESTFAKVFDTKDYRSLTGHLADSISPSLYGNVSSILSNILNVGSSFSNLASTLTPKSAADGSSNSWSGDYDWGFSQYGIPDQMLHDPNLADPYANANDVGGWLTSNCKDQKTGEIGPDQGNCKGSCGDNGTSGVTDCIKRCFGNDLTYSAPAWDVTPMNNTDVNPQSTDYINANCGDIQDAQLASTRPGGSAQTAACQSTKKIAGKTIVTGIDTTLNPRAIINGSSCQKITTASADTTGSTSTWTRMVMYVNDTSTMKSISCYEGGDDQSCKDLGLDTSATSPDTSGSSTTVSSKDAPSYCKDGSAQGSQKIVCSAWLFNDYGYNDPGHRGDADYLKGFLADVKTCVTGNYGSGCKYKKGTLLVDCSGLVDAAVYDGMGVDLKGASTKLYPGNSHLQKIDPSQATAGDIYWTSGHTEVIVSNDTDKKRFNTFGAHDVYSDVTKDISPSGYSWGEAGAVYRVVP